MTDQNDDILEKNRLPEGWRIVRVDDCFDIQQGKQVSKSNRIGENQRSFLRTANVFWGRIDFSELDRMNFTLEEEKRFELKKGDLLVCEGGDIGRTALWNYNLEKCYYQNHLHRLRTKNDNINPYYALYWFQYGFVFARLYFGRANITTIPNLSKSRLSELDINLPSLIEQSAIVETLSSIQSAISEQKNLIEKLRELKKSMMHELFTYGTRGEKTKMTEIGEIPESWEIVEIETLGKLITGNTPSTKNEAFYNSQDIDFVAPADIGNGKYIYNSIKKISFAGLETVRPLPKNSVLCVCIGSSIGNTGKTYHETSCTNQQINAIVCNNFFDSDFIYYLLHFYQKYWSNFATFGPVPILPKGTFGKIEIPVTKDKQEQLVIANGLSEIDKTIEVHTEKLNSIESLFNTLLHELMSGERRVNF